MAPVAAVFALGVIAGLAPEGVTMAVTAAAACALAVCASCFGRYAAALCLTLLLGIGDVCLHSPDPVAQTLLDGETIVEALVTRVEERGSGTLLDALVDSVGADSASVTAIPSERCRIFIPGFTVPVAEGDRLRARCEFDTLRQIAYFPDMTELAAAQKRAGITASGIVRPENVLTLKPDGSLQARLDRARAHVSRLILGSGMEPDTRMFVNAVITGDTSFITAASREAYSRSGIAHVLALSGLHAGILLGLVGLVLSPLIIVSGGRTAAKVLGVAAVWAFALLTGCGAPVVRAAVMATVVVGASIVNRVGNGWNSLFAAALIIMVADPASVVSPGFQLSFAAVAGILLFGRRLNFVDERKRLLYKCVGLLTVSIGAMAATALLSALYFHRMPVWFLAANIVAVPTVWVLVGGGFVTVGLEAAGISGGWLWPVMDTAYRILDTSTHFISTLPGNDFGSRPVSWIAAVCFVAAGVFLWRWAGGRRRADAIGAAATFAGFIALVAMTPLANQPEVYIAGSQSSTEIIASAGHRIHIFTTAPANERNAIADDYTQLLENFRHKRGNPELTVVTSPASSSSATQLSDSILDLGWLKYRFPWLTVGDMKIALVDRATPPSVGRAAFAEADMIVVSDGFRGSIADLIAKGSTCETRIVLAPDLNPRREAGLAAECAKLGVNCHRLRFAPLPNLVQR